MGCLISSVLTSITADLSFLVCTCLQRQFITSHFHVLRLHSFIPNHLSLSSLHCQFISRSIPPRALTCHLSTTYHIIPYCVHVPSPIHSAALSVCSCVCAPMCVDAAHQQKASPCSISKTQIDRQRQRGGGEGRK